MNMETHGACFAKAKQALFCLECGLAKKPHCRRSAFKQGKPDELDDVVRQLPKTGDNTSLTLWALMMAGCLTALTALNRRAKRGN